VHPNDATIVEYRKLLAFIDKKLTDIELRRVGGSTEAVKAEFKRNAAIFKSKIADLERERDAARTANRGASGPALEEMSLHLTEEADALAKKKLSSRGEPTRSRTP